MEVDIRTETSLGDSFSTLLFAFVLIPLLITLNETDLGYVTSRNQKLYHLLFMDNLKFYGKSERELDLLIQIVRIFSHGVGIKFKLGKCTVLVLKTGKMVQTEGIELPDGERMRGYPSRIKLFASVGVRLRVKKLLKSQLNGGNVIQR